MWTYGRSHFSVLEGHRGRPQPLDFGHLPWSPNLPTDVLRKRLALPTQSARYGRLIRSAKRFGSRPSSLFASFLLLDGIVQCPSSLLAFFTGARRMYHSSCSACVFFFHLSGNICWFRIAREFIEFDFCQVPLGLL
jgi:hypothetical protein